MKLSARMVEHLQWMKMIEDGNTGKKPDDHGHMAMKRPTHAENVRTHDALVRRGMVWENRDRTTGLTAAGRAAAR